MDEGLRQPRQRQGQLGIETDVGGFLVVGTEYVGGAGYQIYMIKIDEDGDVAWSQLRQGIRQYIWAMRSRRMTFGGQYYAVALQLPMEGGILRSYLVRTNELGDTLWTSSYGGAGDEYGESVRPDQRRRVYLAGCTLPALSAAPGTVTS